MDWKAAVRKKVKCCACENSMNDSEHINLIALDRAATWPMPVSGNVFAGMETKQAVAVLCDRCIAGGKAVIMYGVEWTENVENVTYHKFADLDPLPTRIHEINKAAMALLVQDPKKN
ncbi:hypothetical protein ES707_22650 [subsurface metagenome]